MEILEPRQMLAADHTLAIFDGNVTQVGAVGEVQIALTAAAFTLAGDSAILGFRAVSTGGDFNPVGVTIRDAQDQPLPSVATSNDLSVLSDSLSLVALPLGNFTVEVTGQGTGAFRLEVFLSGDADGDGSADTDDANLIRASFGAQPGNPLYRVEADANLDGRITSFDLFQWQTNRGNASSIVPLTLTASFAAGSVTPDGDGFLTSQSTVGVAGISIAGADITVNTDGDGQFDDGQITAAADGSLALSNLSVVEGQNTLVVRAADSFGQVRTVQLSVTRDTEAPVASVNGPNASDAAIPSVVLEFDERVQGPLLDPASYAIQREGQPVGNPAIGISSVTKLDDFTYRLALTAPVPEGATYNLVLVQPITDLAGIALAESTISFNAWASLRITEVSPDGGEEFVSPTREVIVRFSEEVDTATLTASSIQVMANSTMLSGRIVPSSTKKFVTFYPDNAWPASTQIRIIVNGDLIRGMDGSILDANNDAISGGVLEADFRTLPLTQIPGTNVEGYVRDSYTQLPIQGATIRVDAFPALNAVTDANGYFLLRDLPAPDFFVHIDGSTATNAPAGAQYPVVGKKFHSVAGQQIRLNHHGHEFDIYLPPMAAADVTPLSATLPTDVGFGAAGMAQLAQMFPNVNASEFDKVKVTFAPGGAVNDFGQAAVQAIVIPVPPDKLPAPLPEGANPSLVISIQGIGATSFDVPAAITFPNLENRPLGAKVELFSFDHDKGAWKPIGLGTVVSDGQGGTIIQSDPGVGILAPGWHFVDDPGSWLHGGNPGPNPGDKIVVVPPEAKLLSVGHSDVISITLQAPKAPKPNEHDPPEDAWLSYSFSLNGSFNLIYEIVEAPDMLAAQVSNGEIITFRARLRSEQELKGILNGGKAFNQDILFGARLDVSWMKKQNGAITETHRTLLRFHYVDYSDDKADDTLKFRDAAEHTAVSTRAVAVLDMPAEWVHVSNPQFQFSIIGTGLAPFAIPYGPVLIGYLDFVPPGVGTYRSPLYIQGSLGTDAFPRTDSLSLEGEGSRRSSIQVDIPDLRDTASGMHWTEGEIDAFELGVLSELENEFLRFPTILDVSANPTEQSRVVKLEFEPKPAFMEGDGLGHTPPQISLNEIPTLASSLRFGEVGTAQAAYRFHELFTFSGMVSAFASIIDRDFLASHPNPNRPGTPEDRMLPALVATAVHEVAHGFGPYHTTYIPGEQDVMIAVDGRGGLGRASSIGVLAGQGNRVSASWFNNCVG